MDKKKLIEVIREHLMTELEVLKTAAKATYEAATHEESKPENEYDTRGLEASYLAGAQAKRIAETEELLVVLKHVDPKTFTSEDKINATAIVEIDNNGKHQLLFILAKGGGVKVQFEGREIQIVTPSSPLGEALQDLKKGDIAVIDSGDSFKEFEILNVW